jgi:hypothetical protein
MAYCPTCKQAWTGGETECPNDHVALVDELPFQAVAGEGVTWVEIASTGTDDEARIIQGFMEAEGIPAQIENVKFSMEPINFGTMGDIRVYVGAENEARAQQLMRDRQTEYDNLEDDASTIVTDEGAAEMEDDQELTPE